MCTFCALPTTYTRTHCPFSLTKKKMNKLLDRKILHPFIRAIGHTIHTPSTFRSKAIRFVCNHIVLIFSIFSITIAMCFSEFFHFIIIHFIRPFFVYSTSNRSSVLRHFHTQPLFLSEFALYNQFVIFLFTDDAININTIVGLRGKKWICLDETANELARRQTKIGWRKDGPSERDQ